MIPNINSVSTLATFSTGNSNSIQANGQTTGILSNSTNSTIVTCSMQNGTSHLQQHLHHSPGSTNNNVNANNSNTNTGNSNNNSNNNNNSSNNNNNSTGTSNGLGSYPYNDNEACGIKDVWHHNLDEEFRNIREIIRDYPFVAMDTEFPGVVARPIGEFRSNSEYQYHLLRCNVDLLRIIQLGLTFLNEHGETPDGFSTWQFNFKFNLTEDMYAQDSIDLLTNSGIQFKKHEEEGIDPYDFAELLMTSGIVLCDNVKWLSFHSGYDFGYLLKILTDQNLPQEESEFFELLKVYFPAIYDVKYLMKSCKNLKGGLQEVAEQLDLERIGPQHQAGSDSLLTGITFFKMREMFFEDNIDDAKYCGHLYGLGTSYVVNGNTLSDGSDTIISSSTTSTTTSPTAVTAGQPNSTTCMSISS